MATAERSEFVEDDETVLLRMDIRRLPDAVVIALSGELCEITAPDLDAAIQETILRAADPSSRVPAPTVTLDLSDLRFLGAAGLSVFVCGDRDLRKTGGGLRLVGAQPIVKRMLRITGLHPLEAESPDPPSRPSIQATENMFSPDTPRPAGCRPQRAPVRPLRAPLWPAAAHER